MGYYNIFTRIFFIGSAAISLAMLVLICCIIAKYYGIKIDKKASILEILKIMAIVAIYQLIYNSIYDIAPTIIRLVMFYGYIALFYACINGRKPTRKYKTE